VPHPAAPGKGDGSPPRLPGRLPVPARRQRHGKVQETAEGGGKVPAPGWEILNLTASDLAVVALMIVVFALALILPYPRRR
jgi:hypothetical protein